MLATPTTQQGRLKMLLRLLSFVGVALVLALYSNSTIAEDCGKTSGGAMLACTFMDESAIFDVPLDFYSYGLEIKSFEAQENRNDVNTYTVVGYKNGDIFQVTLNLSIDTYWEPPVWKRTFERSTAFPVTGKMSKIKVKGGYGRMMETADGCSIIRALNWNKYYLWAVYACGEATEVFLDIFANGRKNSRADLLASKNANANSNASSTPVTTKSAEYRACQTAKGDSSKTAKFMQSLSQSQLTKFLNKNQSCDAF